MRLKATALLCIVLFAAPARAQLTLPAEVKGEPGAFVRVPATTEGKAVRWVAFDAGLNVFPAELLKDSRTAVVVAVRPGRYRLLAYTSIADAPSEPAVCVVVIGDAPPVPVPPGPDPPTPPGPEPTDPLYLALKAAWAKEVAGEKKYRADLAALYRQAGERTVNDASIKTVGDLLALMRKAAASLIPAASLPALRRGIADAANAELPRDPATLLDPMQRQRCGAFFTRVATALEHLK